MANGGQVRVDLFNFLRCCALDSVTPGLKLPQDPCNVDQDGTMKGREVD